VPFFVEVVLPERTFNQIGLVIAFAVETLE